MEWNSMWNDAANQGALFWTATGTVALGVTLILSAGIMHLQKWRHRSGVQSPSLPTTRSKVGAGTHTAPQEISLGTLKDSAGTSVQVSENVTLPAGPPRASTPAGLAHSSEMLILLARLRTAADRLDEFRRQNGGNPAPTGESPLKEPLDGVDYLFRTGTA
jgi:hypothetical protein